MCEICDGKTSEQIRRELLARIARHDYTMISVREEWARDRGWVAPGFVYSVGLWSFRRVPEVIVVGAPARPGDHQPRAGGKPLVGDRVDARGQVRERGGVRVGHRHPRTELHQRGGRRAPGHPGTGDEHRRVPQGRQGARPPGHAAIPDDAVSHSL